MPRRNSYGPSREDRGLGDRRGRSDGKSFGEGFMPQRKRMCRFCADKQLRIDYKDGKALRPYISEREKITPSRMTGLCAYHQRRMTEAIKRSRILGFIPFATAQKDAI